jgi:hypothetical protein
MHILPDFRAPVTALGRTPVFSGFAPAACFPQANLGPDWISLEFSGGLGFRENLFVIFMRGPFVLASRKTTR